MRKAKVKYTTIGGVKNKSKVKCEMCGSWMNPVNDGCINIEKRRLYLCSRCHYAYDEMILRGR